MVIRSKIDTFFVKFISIVIFIIGLVSFFPLFLEGGNELPVIMILTSTFFLLTSFILWSVFSIKYIFYQDYLMVKGGPFRSRIPYEKITKVASTREIFTGYRILSSRDAIEIFYTTAFSGSVKISPREKREFISELKRRCPTMKIQEPIHE